MSGVISSNYEPVDAEVRIELNGKTYPAVLNGSAFQVEIDGTDFAGASSLNAGLTVRDGNGQSVQAETSRSYLYDTEIDEPVITLDPIGDDYIINFNESQDEIAITGSVSHANDGDTVYVVVDGQVFTGKLVDGRFSIPVDGQLLAENNSVEASITVSDKAGNQASAAEEQSYRMMTEIATPVIHFSTLADDNVINAAEANTPVTVFGTVEHAREDDQLMITIGGKEYLTTVQSGAFHVEVDGALLAQNNEITAKVNTRDWAGNTAEATATHNYRVDTEIAEPVITINKIAEDDIINLVESQTETMVISGTVTNAQDNDEIVLKIGDTEYRGILSDGTFSVPVSTQILLNHSKIEAELTTSDDAHNSATGTAERGYHIDTEYTPTISLNKIAGDNVLNIAESQGKVTVTGTVSDVADGEDVLVSIGCENCDTIQWIEMWTKVQNGAFSVDFAGSEIKDANYNLVKATVTSRDDAGNIATIEARQSFTQDLQAPEVSVSVNPLADNDVFNQQERAQPQHIVSGTVSGIQEDETLQSVVVQVNGQDHQARLTGHNYQIEIPTEQLLAVNEIRVHATVTDSADNITVAENSRSYQTSVPAPVITLNSITEDDIINKAEADGDVFTVSGRVENVPDNTEIALNTGFQNVKAVVADGQFSVQVNKAFFGIGTSTTTANGTITAMVTLPNDAGVDDSTFATRPYTVDLVNATAISIDSITGDNVVDEIELAQPYLTISGKVTDGKTGSIVTVSISNITYTTTVQADGRYSVEAETARIFPNGNEGKYTVNASVARIDEAGNTGSGNASTRRIFVLDKTPPRGTIVLDDITGDNVLNQNESTQSSIKVSGRVNGLTDGDDVQSITIQVGGISYQAGLMGTSFSVEIPTEVMKANTTVSATGVVKDITGRTAEAVGDTQDYRLQTTPPELSITVDQINNNQAINAKGLSESVLIKGTLILGDTAVSDTATLRVSVNSKDYTPVINGNQWTLELPATTLAYQEGRLNIQAYAGVADQYGNTAEHQASGSYEVDTIAPVLVIELDDIALDNILDSIEQNSPVVISGKVSGDYQAGDKVMLTINGAKEEAAIGAGGIFTTTVAGSILAAAAVPMVHAVITTDDAAGNSASAQTSREYSVKNGDIDIKLNVITGDDLINVTEAKQQITLSGSVSGSDAAPGQFVEINVNGEILRAEVQSGYTFSAQIDAAKLLATPGYAVTAAISGNNGAEAKTSRSYEVAAEAAAKIDITQIGNGFDVDLPQSLANTRISGVIELDGLFAVGKNSERMRQITVNIGEKTYTAGVKADRSFFIDIPTSELAKLNGEKLSFKVEADPVLFDPIQLRTNSYYVVPTNRYEAVKVKSVEINNPYLSKGADGQYTVADATDAKVSISGTVGGTAKANDTVSLEVGGKIYTTKVSDTLSFHAEVLAADLAADSDHSVRAVLSTVDLSGKNITVADSENYAAQQQVSGKFVSPHSPVNGATVNSDHTSAGHNLAYFIQKTGNLNAGSYRIPFGGNINGPAVIKYHFMTLDEIAALPENYNRYMDRASMTTYSSYLQDLVRSSYQEISAVTNIQFVEVATSGEANTNYFMANLINGFESSAAIAYNGGLVAWNSGQNYMGWGEGFLRYTVLHEVTHTLGMGHTSNGFTGDYQKEENSEFSFMSYNAYSNSNLFLDKGQLRTYDLAYLHYGYGVAPDVRAGDDTYTFKNYNMYSQDGDRYIWDGGGIDTFDASQEAQGVNVNLTPGSWIYVGNTLEKTFAVESTSTYTMRDYLGFDSSVSLSGNTGAVTLNNYTEGQAFIGYGTQIENLIGSAHADVLTGNNADNNIYGGDGNDIIRDGAGNDYLDGGKGADTLIGGTGNDTYVVDDENDTVIEAAGEGDADHVYSSVNHTLSAHVEHLTLIGSTAISGTGNDADNTLRGNNTDNILNGLGGNDRIIGGGGNNTLTGGEGRDVFVFDRVLDGSINTITDFVYGEDTIELSSAIFGSLSNGMADFADYISFQNSTGYLYYDSDGNGQADGIHFATLLNKDLTLDSSNFNIV